MGVDTPGYHGKGNSERCAVRLPDNFRCQWSILGDLNRAEFDDSAPLSETLGLSTAHRQNLYIGLSVH